MQVPYKVIPFKKIRAMKTRFQGHDGPMVNASERSVLINIQGRLSALKNIQKRCLTWYDDY